MNHLIFLFEKSFMTNDFMQVVVFFWGACLIIFYISFLTDKLEEKLERYGGKIEYRTGISGSGCLGNFLA